MAEQTSESFAGKAIGSSIGAVGGAIATWLVAGFGGSPGHGLLALIAAAGAVCGLASSLMYRRYLGVLAAGAKRKGSLERETYIALKQSLSGGGLAARLYTRWLTRFLSAIDRFFGDAGLIDQQVLARAFGMKNPATLWTGPAYDRCMLLAAIYPLTTIMIVWTISGHVGPAEAALRLKPGLPGWWRALEVAAVAMEGFAIWHVLRSTGWRSVAWAIVGGAFAVAVSVAVAGAVAVGASFLLAGVGGFVCALMSARVLTVAFASSISGAGAIAGIVVGTTTIAVIGAINFAAGAIMAGGIAVIVVGGLTILNRACIELRRQGLWLFFLSMLLGVSCMGFVVLVAPLSTWGKAGPMLLFLGLVPLLNAPFDWASIGLTRALLRRGLEQGGWWPLLYALLDAFLAVVIIVVLSLTTVIGIQVFNALTVYAGRKPILPLQRLFDGIAAEPAAPEFWWIYALLISTMIPSILNLMIGGASLMRGVPLISEAIVRRMPEGKAVPPYDRAWIALVLTAQIIGGAILGIAAQAILALSVAFLVMPGLGLELLEMCRWIADLNLPARTWNLFVARRN